MKRLLLGIALLFGAISVGNAQTGPSGVSTIGPASLSITPLPSAQISNPLFRNPTIYDDSTRGNAVGELWLNSKTGVIWQASSVVASAAVWVPYYSSATLPCDAVASVTVCYGTKPLTSSWLNGNLFDITCTDSTTATIKAISGAPDIATLQSHLNSAIVAGIGGCQVTKWYDQSGNANDSTPADTTHAPWARIRNGAIHIAYNGTVDVGNSLQLPAITWSTASISCFASAYQQSLYNSQAIVELGTTSSNFTGIYNNGVGSGSAINQLGVANSGSKAVLMDEQSGIWSWINTSGSGSGGVNEVFSSPSADQAIVGTPIGGTIGNSRAFANFKLAGEIDGVACWNGLSMSSAQSSAVRDAFYVAFSTPLQAANDLLMVTGGSWTWANGSQVNGGQGGAAYGYDRQTLYALSRSIRIVNWSTPGHSDTQIDTEYSAHLSPIFSSNYNKKIFLLDNNGNDYDAFGSPNQNLTPAQSFAHAQSICTAAKTSGFATFATTIIPYPDAANANVYNLTWAPAFNTLLKAGPLDCTVIDVASDPTLGNSANLSNGTYFVQSGIPAGHPTALGYGIWKGYLIVPINAALGQ